MRSIVTSEDQPHHCHKMSPSKYSRPFTVVVEGNIGSGKSTFLSHFSSKQPEDQGGEDGLVDILAEPVNKWRDVDGHNLLEVS